MAVIWIPWGIKLVYGITADSVAIFGSRKKNWLILMALIEIFGLLMLTFVEFTDISWFIFYQVLVAMAGAFMDVVADAYMVM